MLALILAISGFGISAFAADMPSRGKVQRPSPMRRTGRLHEVPRLYPVCFYNTTRPDKDEFSSYYVPSLATSLRLAAGLPTNANISPSPDGRWLIAITTDVENARAGAVWPRIACIGDASNSDRVSAEETCVAYVSDFMKNSNYVRFYETTVSGTTVVSEYELNQNFLHCRTVRTASDP
jgi:hypothetical protein